MDRHEIDIEKVGKNIAALRKERGYTGERLAERLNVTPQAISKWENARCLPDTAILPALAEALDCSIDSLLCARELFVLEAVYTDGQTHLPVTRFVNGLVRGNRLDLCVSEPFAGASLESDRLKILTVKFQTPDGIYFSYALQNEKLVLDTKSVCFANDREFEIIGAYYGNAAAFSSAMKKMEHYEYFKWDRIAVNHETFPSNTASDDTEYLTLIYLNAQGIHVISCPEGDAVYYGRHRTQLLLRDHTRCILKDVMRLSWEDGPDGGAHMCPWAGALYAALKYMGETYSYHQIMGMSGACYRVCFTDVWDYSCTDALVAFDYVTPLYDAIGYSFRIVERLEKQERRAERQAVMDDIQGGKPVLAINLRVAPEWGVITGYTDNGSRFLCRTYFDGEVFAALEGEDSQSGEDRRKVFEENEGYLFNDFWPFIILHFGEKRDTPPPLEILKTSLDTLIRSFRAEECRGYHQGEGAYRAWIEGLSREADFELEKDGENVLRRLSVNDTMLCNLIDARRGASAFLRENGYLLPEPGRGRLEKIAENCRTIADSISEFRHRVFELSACTIAYNAENAFAVSTPELRGEQIGLLKAALALEEENCGLAEMILRDAAFHQET